MSDPKAKNVVKDVSKESEKDPSRFLNLPKNLELSFGTYSVSELSAFDLMEVVADGFLVLVDVVGDVDLDSGSAQDIDLVTLVGVVKNPTTKAQLCRVFSKYCREPDPQKFENLTVTDLRKLIDIIFEVTDVQEVKELFLGLMKLQNQFQENTPSTAPSESK